MTKDAAAFRTALPPRGRLLALDVGSKTIGLAVSDVERSIASALHTVHRRKFAQDAEVLKFEVEQQNAIGLVVGYPLNMDGSEGPRCQSTRAFVRELEKFIALPTLLWDERLSSAKAEEAMMEAQLSRVKREQRIDKIAAAVILQGFLDS